MKDTIFIVTKSVIYSDDPTPLIIVKGFKSLISANKELNEHKERFEKSVDISDYVVANNSYTDEMLMDENEGYYDALNEYSEKEDDPIYIELKVEELEIEE